MEYLPGDGIFLFVQVYGGDDRVSMMFSLPHFGFFKVIGAVDECDMGKSLWIVAQSFNAVGAYLFRKQAKLPRVV